MDIIPEPDKFILENSSPTEHSHDQVSYSDSDDGFTPYPGGLVETQSSDSQATVPNDRGGTDLVDHDDRNGLASFVSIMGAYFVKH